jgi:glycosyltransferase involved in cell wall biosynthesis
LQPLVSIIIPAYNAAPYIGRTILSVTNQLYSNWELIIVNDGSTDDTSHVVQPFLGDSRIHFYDKANTGVSDTRNFGVANSEGKYLCFLDADDVFYPSNLQEKVELLEGTPKLDFVCADVEVINEKDEATGQYFKAKGGFLLNELLLWEGFNIPGPSCIIISREAFDHIWGWDPDFSTAADQDFFFRVAAKYAIGYINKPLTAYRVLANSMSRNIQAMEKDHIGVYRKAVKNKLFKSYWFKQQCYANLYKVLAGSWWVNGHNKPRAIKFVLKSILAYPPLMLKILSKNATEA